MRVGMRIALGLTAALVAASPAAAKDCVEPYGELVQVSEFETVVRVKPECEAMQHTSIAPTEITLGSSMAVDETVRPRSSLLPALPDSGELAPRRLSAKRPVSCSDPAVCGRSRVALAQKPYDCENGRGFAVGVSDGLFEVKVLDTCRHLMNPNGMAEASVVPTVLAPDWELDFGSGAPQGAAPVEGQADRRHGGSAGGRHRQGNSSADRAADIRRDHDGRCETGDDRVAIGGSLSRSRHEACRDSQPALLGHARLISKDRTSSGGGPRHLLGDLALELQCALG